MRAFFREIVFGYVLIACFALVLFLVFFGTHQGKDPSQYLVKVNEEPLLSHQKRHYITKDLLLCTPDAERMHMRLRSQEADVVLQMSGGKVGVVEHLHGLKGIMQEKLFYLSANGAEVVKNNQGDWETVEGDLVAQDSVGPLQTVRYFEAGTAKYFHRKGTILANDVKLYKLNLPGHQFVEHFKTKDFLMKGTCASIQFALVDKQFKFSANDFNLAVY